MLKIIVCFLYILLNKKLFNVYCFIGICLVSLHSLYHNTNTEHKTNRMLKFKLVFCIYCHEYSILLSIKDYIMCVFLFKSKNVCLRIFLFSIHLFEKQWPGKAEFMQNIDMALSIVPT